MALAKTTRRAMREARDQAAQTPEEVRKAFLAKRYSVPGLELEPWSIGIMWILEELEHPLIAQPALDGEGKPVLHRVTHRQLAQAIFAFADSEAAFSALEGGVESFDAEAFRFVKGLPLSTVKEADALIPTIIQEGLATLPGAGGSNPPATGS